jgi:hypothetical protein
LLITLIEAVLGVLIRGKIFRHAEMSGAKFFWRPYLYKIWVFMERVKADNGFSLCFDGVFSTCRNVFPMTFLHVEKLKLLLRRAIQQRVIANLAKSD